MGGREIVMDTKEIQKLICIQEVLKFNIPCENVSFFFHGEADVLSLNRNKYISEFEVKISKSDFKAEKKKVTKWMFFEMRTETHIPNYFWYVCNEGLIQISEIPIYAGLMYVVNGELEIIKKPLLLHKKKADTERIMTKFCKVMSERIHLGNCRLTYENKEHKKRSDKIFQEYPDNLLP